MQEDDLKRWRERARLARAFYRDEVGNAITRRLADHPNEIEIEQLEAAAEALGVSLDTCRVRAAALLSKSKL